LYFDAASFQFRPSGTVKVAIDSSGNVGIGTASPGSYRLNVNGPAYVHGGGSNGINTYSTSGYGLYGESSATYGVYGRSTLASSGGVLGYDAQGTYYGILGHANAYSLYGSGTLYNSGNAQITGDMGVGAAATGGFRMNVVGSSSQHGLRMITGNSSYAASVAYTQDSSQYVYLGYANAYGAYGVANGGGIAMRGDNNTYGSQGGLGWTTYGVICNTGLCGGANGWGAWSDIRLKEDIRVLGAADGLDAITRLKPVRFHWKDKKQDKLKGDQLGFIAQDMEEVFPEVVITSIETRIETKDGKKETFNDTKSISYADLVVPLVKAVQELKALFDGLVAKVEKLYAMVTGHGEAIKKLQAENESLRKDLNDLRKAFEAFRAAPRADNDNGVGPLRLRADNDNTPVETKKLMKAAGMGARPRERSDAP
jgi:hypothetical protein